MVAGFLSFSTGSLPFLPPISSTLNSESVEFFTHVRKKWRQNVKRRPASSHVVDVCCGHGFTGLLFAIFERECTLVTLLDRQRPNSFGMSCFSSRLVDSHLPLDSHLFSFSFLSLSSSLLFIMSIQIPFLRAAWRLHRGFKIN